MKEYNVPFAGATVLLSFAALILELLLAKLILLKLVAVAPVKPEDIEPVYVFCP